MESDNTSDEEYNPQQMTTRQREHRTARKSTASLPQPVNPPIYATRRQTAKNATKAVASSSFDRSMETFNPELSQRERRKLSRKFSGAPVRRPQGAVYDEAGVHILTQMDLCDCLNERCPGCWFECEKCGSLKCGTECRVYRKYVLDSVEYHGYDKTLKNPILIKMNK